MNTDNICISGAEIQEVKWKIGSNPWASNFIQPFTAGDTATAILKVTLDDCSEFEGKTLEAFVQVPNDAKDIVKIFALIDANNQALFTLPTELLWWPGDYNVNFMFADGDKVNYSNVLNAAYTVNENPALAGQNPPTILPGDKADYEDLISRLSTQTAKGEIQIPKLESENTRAEGNISTITGKNNEAEQKISDLTGKIAEGNAAQVKWQDTIDNGESKIGELDVKIQETNQKMIEVDNKISDIEVKIVEAEAEIDKMEEAVAKGVKEIDDAVNALPDQIKKIEDKTTEGLTSLTDQEAASVQNIKNQETTSTQNVNNQGLTSVQAIKDQEATSKQELTQEGINQRNLISTAGNTEVLKVTNEGHTQKNSITTEGDNQKGLITAEGTKQTGLVKTQGDTSLAAVQKVQTDVEAIIQGDPAGGNAIALGGKTRAEFDDDISNRTYALDNRIVYGFLPGERNIENLKHGVHVKNPLTNGDGTTWSEDTDSLSGVFAENGSFYCGEGYWNKFDNFSNYGAVVDDVGKIDEITYRIKLSGNTQSYGGLGGITFSDAITSGDEISCTFEIVSGEGALVGFEDYCFISNGSGSFFLKKDYELKDGRIGATIKWDNKGFYSIRVSDPYRNLDLGDNSYITIKKVMVKNTSKQTSVIEDDLEEDNSPHVKDTAPYGKVIIKENWTSVNYTILNLDENYKEQEYYIDSNGVNLHLKNDGITRNKYISIFLIYKGVLTQVEKDNEILKSSSEKLYFNNAGVYEPVPGAKKRANEYGQTKNYVYIENVSTDIQLVEKNKIVYTEASDGTKKRDAIDNSGNISGDGGIIDVAGNIRLASSMMGRTKVVIENDE